MKRTVSRLSAVALTAIIALPVLFAGQVYAQPQQGSTEVLNRLRAAYDQTDALRATFTQEMDGARMAGTIVLSGDRYRIETADQILVTDGTTAWAYSKDDNQVLVNQAVEDVTTFAPSAFFTRYPEHFQVSVAGSETLGGVRHDILQLTPRDADARQQVREVLLYVRATDSLPTRVHLVDGHGSTMRFELRDLERNPHLTADTFRFRTPAGAEVVDLR